MILRAGFLAIVITFASAAQTVPGGWKVVKDTRGFCQAAVPPDWTVNSELASARNGNQTLSMGLVFEHDAANEPLPELLTRRAVKVYENTGGRRWLEGKGTQFGPRPASRPWNVWTALPNAKKGSCHLTLSIYPGGDEAIAKQVVASVSPAK